MNAVLDVLRLRRVRLDYVSPPICQVILSGSGSSLMLEAVEGPGAPFDLMFSGQCERFLTWSNLPGVICASLYSANNPSDPLTGYSLSVDCVTIGSVSLCSDGWWQYSTLTADGVESDRSDPVLVSFGTRTSIPIVKPADAVRFNLFRNPDVNDPAGIYTLVLSSVSDSAIEVCDLTGIYRLQSISENGASDLSNPISHTTYAGCIPYFLADILGPQDTCCLDVPYVSQLTAVGGVGPYLWELVSGSLPPGIVYHTGLFLGTTAPIDGVPVGGGLFTFTARCTDAGGHTLEKTFSISALGLVGPLPDATTDTAYSEALTASGANPPFVFSYVSGALPSGFVMDANTGIVSGTANFTGSYSWTIDIIDSIGFSCRATVSLDIVGCPDTQSFPAITWNAPVGVTQSMLIILDTKRRNLLASTFITNLGQPVRLDLVSTISNSFTSEIVDTGSGNTFGESWMGYDPVNDIVGIASQTSDWTRFDPVTGSYSVAGAQSIPIGQGSLNLRLAVDTKRGHMMGTRLQRFQLVEITPSSFTSLNTSANLWANLTHCCYNEASDQFVLLGSGANPPIAYVDPVSYAVSLSASTVGITEGGPAGHRIISLDGTPWIVFCDNTSHLVIVDTTNDSIYWQPSEIIGVIAPPTPAAAIQDMVYNSCSGVLTIANDSFLQQFDVPNKTFVQRISAPTGAWTSTVFDPLANRVYGLLQESVVATHHIYTI